MKRITLALTCLPFLLASFASCAPKNEVAPTCKELIDAYEDAGFHVFHCEEVNAPKTCYVKVWADDEYDYAFFYFFDSAEDAEAWDDEREYNVLIYLFSVIYGDPHWLFTETYGNIEYEYCNDDLMQPFYRLID